MVEVTVAKSNRETIQKHREMLENLADALNSEIGSKGKIGLFTEKREYGWGYLISQQTTKSALKRFFKGDRDVAVFEPVGRPELVGYEADTPVLVQARVYAPEAMETIKRVVSEYAGKPESNVAKVEISQQF